MTKVLADEFDYEKRGTGRFHILVTSLFKVSDMAFKTKVMAEKWKSYYE